MDNNNKIILDLYRGTDSMRHLDLCSGTGIVATACGLLDIETVAFCEIDKFCQEILEKRFPGVPIISDLKEINEEVLIQKGVINHESLRTIDLVTAGFPCQPFSHAGQRKGSEDDRYLWPEIIRIIRTIQPTWFIGENVFGITSMEQSDSEIIMETEADVCKESEMVLETIRKDLENAGYKSVPIIIPACSVGAPHQRYRIFIVGHSELHGRVTEQKLRGNETTSDKRSKEEQKSSREFKRATRSINEFGLSGSKFRGKQCSKRAMASNNPNKVEIMGNSDNAGSGTQRNKYDRNRQKSDKGRDGQSQRGIIGPSEIVGNTECSGFSGESRGRTGKEFENGYSGIEAMADTKSKQSSMQSFTEYSKQEQGEFGRSSSKNDILADTCGTGCEEFNTTTESAGQGHSTGCSNEARTNGTVESCLGGNSSRLSNRLHRSGGHEDSSGIFSTFEEIFTTVLGQIKWPAGYGAEQYDYEPPRVATGVKNRANRLKALGNAIVSWQILPFLLAIKLINQEEGEG